MAKKPASINLIKTDKKETINQIVNWALTIGRGLVIFVEIIALSALLYRFILDNQLRDVHTKIKQEQAILESQKKNEQTYKNLQDRLNVISSVSDKGSESVKIFKDIISFAPLGMTFSNISLTENSIRIEANVSSIYPLSFFINSLKTYKDVESVSIDKIENKTANAVINISITVGLKQKGVANAATSTK
jgi:Tfp pilus assembly protein PilN